MEIEHSLDSDTSESWSLLDLNETEYATEAKDEAAEVGPASNSNGVGFHPEETVQNLNGENEHSAFNEPSNTYQDCQVLYKGKFPRDDELEKLSENNFRKTITMEVDEMQKNSNDYSIDSDSISIISENECDDVKLNPFETDDISEEVSESNLLSRTHPNILKRKRKRLKLNCRDSSEESINSDFMIPDGNYYSNVQSIQYKNSENDMQVTEYDGAPVYRHYRNNVANTMLSMAMGIIFTGVACIAIGHFLGVHDAQHTAGEMMETLKRLQMENVLLHTRLAQLSRAFFNRGGNKMALLAKEVPRDCFTNYLDLHGNNRDIIKSNEKKENVERPVFFRGRPIEFSMDFKNPTNKVTLNENQFGMLIQDHDRQNFFNITNLSESFTSVPHCTTILPEDRYIATGSKVAMRSVKPSGLNSKKLKRLADSKVLDTLENQRQDCLAVREKNFSRFRRFLIENESNREKGGIVKTPSKEVDVFKYPQPENYYRNEEKYVVGSDKITMILNSGEKSCDELKFVPHLQGSGLNSSYPVNSTGDRKSTKSKKAFLKKQKETKKPKSRKSCDSKKEARPVKKSDDDRKKFRVHEKCKDCPRKKNRKNKEDKKKEKEYSEENRSKYQKNKNKSKEHESHKKERMHVKARRAKAKEDVFAPCKKEWKKVKGFIPKFDYSRNRTMCEECMKRSESWFYKWAKGRENHRRNHRLSDWQFARAKSRAYSREGDALWQFKRALGRRNSRNDQYFNFQKRGEKYHRQKGGDPSYAFPFSMKKKHVKSFLNLFGLLL